MADKHVRSIAYGTMMVVSIVLAMALSGCTNNNALPRVQRVAAATDRDIAISLFLVGDAGKPALGGEPLMQALSREMGASPGEPVVVFLGDNVYPSGLPPVNAPKRLEMENVLDVQVQTILKTRAHGVFVPGNHDWDHSGVQGWAKIRMQDTFVDHLGQGRVRLLPNHGCPGPHVADIGDKLRLVFLDTQWWLHKGPKPIDAYSGCQTFSAPTITAALSKALREAGDRHVVVAAHHPLMSSAKHGGYFTWKDHLFPLTSIKPWLYVPLPLIGSIYPLSRQWGMNRQDLSSRAYKAMRAAIGEAMKRHPPLVFAGGHEHALEVHQGQFSRYVLVSGAGVFGHLSPTSYRDNTLFAATASGFMRLDILQDGRVRLGVISVDEAANVTEVFSMFLKMAPLSEMSQR